MEMRHSKLAFVLALLGGSCLTLGPAHSAEQVFTAADLKSACADGSSKICSAYISGYAQGFYYSSASSKAGFTPCVTRDLNEPKAEFITTQFMKDHPEMMAQGAASVVAEALVSAYPCTASR
jgi:hypothetical protein